LAELQFDRRAQANEIAIVEYSLVRDWLSIDKRYVMSLQQVPLAVTEERGVVPRQVAHQWDISVAIRPGSSQDDMVVQADEITTDGINPEEEPAFQTGCLDMGYWSCGNKSARHEGRARRGHAGSGVS